MKRRLKHHHEGTIEAPAQLPERVPDHQRFFQCYSFQRLLQGKSLVGQFWTQKQVLETVALEQSVRVVQLKLCG